MTIDTKAIRAKANECIERCKLLGNGWERWAAPTLLVLCDAADERDRLKADNDRLRAERDEARRVAVRISNLQRCQW